MQRFGTRIHGGLAIWMITHECTQRCGYCAISHGGQARGIPDPRKAFGIARKLAKHGFREVIVAGGEPLLVPYLADVVDEMSSFVETAMFTGGAPGSTKRLLARIGKSLGRMVFSLDAADESLNDAIRGRSGATRDLLALVEAVKERAPHVHVSFNTVVSRMNADVLPAVWDLIERYSPTGWSLTLAGENMGYVPTDHFLDEDALAKFYFHTAPSLASRLGHEGVEFVVLPAPFPFLDGGIPVEEWGKRSRDRSRELAEEMGRFSRGDFNLAFVEARGCPLAGRDVIVGPGGEVYPCSQAPIMRPEFVVGRLDVPGRTLGHILDGGETSDFVGGLPHGPCARCWAPSNMAPGEAVGIPVVEGTR